MQHAINNWLIRIIRGGGGGVAGMPDMFCDIHLQASLDSERAKKGHQGPNTKKCTRKIATRPQVDV